MNTLSRLDSYLSSLVVRRTPKLPSSTSTPPPLTPPTRTLTPPSLNLSTFPSSASSSSSSSSLSPPTPNTTKRHLSNLPPTPTRGPRTRTTNRRRPPTSTSIQLPPPTTPFLLRIALALWSILLAFWRSLVVETRAERSQRRRRKGALSLGVRKSGSGSGFKSSSSLIVGASSGHGESGGLGGSGVSGGSSDEGSASEGEVHSDDGEWVDPVTRAPSGGAHETLEEPSDSEFTRRQGPDLKFSFRLRSAETKNVLSSTTISQPSTPSLSGRITPPTPPQISAISQLQRQPFTPISILANPSDRFEHTHPPSPTSSTSSKTSGNSPNTRSSTRLLPNPLSTSLLDPSVPAVPTRTSPQGSGAHSEPRSLHIPHHPTPFHLQKTLILDLDETLIHSTSRPIGYAASAGGGLLGLSSGLFGGGRRSRRGEGHTVEVVLNGRSTTYHVYKRPYVDFFLKKVASWYTLVIYTASMPEYADPVIDWLDNGRGLFAKKLYRDSCFLQPNGSYIKDLALVETDLSRVCFMDNSPISYSWNKANALPIEGWTSDPNDEALLHSIPVLDSLRFVTDVRRILGIRGFS